MKKRLALLLSVAMAFSMFANVAFGADATLTTQQKYDALVEAGIFNGIPGSSDPQLNVQTDRAQFAKILALTTGLEQVTGVTTFKDAGYATNWAKGYIEAVVKAGYMNGVGGEKFNLTGKITGEQMAKSFALALGLEEVKDAAAIDGVSAWATGWVTAIKNAGFDFSMNGKWNTPVTRAVLIDAAYAVREQVAVTVTSTKAIDEKTVEVTFSDKEVVKVTLDKALVEGEKTTVEVKHSNGQTYKVEVTLQALAVEAKVLGLQKVEASLTRAVDATKAKVEIKRGSTVLTSKEVKFSDDNTTIQVELGSKMMEGEYTLTVSGASEKAVSTTFKVEAEKVAKIELLGDQAAVAKDFDSVSIGFKVSNQYGDDITKTANINWAASKGFISVDGSMLTISNANGNVNVGKYNLGEKITITGVEATNYQTTVSAVVTVSEFARVDKIDFKGLYNADKKELNTASDFSSFYVLFDAYDQYGNKLTKTQLTNSLYVASTNPSIANVETTTSTVYGQQPVIYEKQGANYDSLAVKLAEPAGTVKFDGKVTINFIATMSGKSFGFDIDVAKAATVEKFTLLKPEQEVAVGETVKIPFVAYDQFGKEITSYSALAGKISISGTPGYVLKKDAVTKNLVIEFTAPNAEQTVYLYSNVNGTANSSNISFAVKKAAVPAQVVSVGSSINLGVNATKKLNADNIKITDQYGRDMSLEKVINAGYTLKLTNNNSTIVAADTDVITSKDGAIVLTGLTKGTANIELALVKNGTTVNGSSFTFNANVVDKGAIAEYKLSVAETIADQSTVGVAQTTYGDKYQVAVNVVGVKADGSEVALSKDEYDVITTNSGLTYNKATGKLTANLGTDAFKDSSTVKAAVIVNVNSADTPTELKQEVTISNAALSAKEITIGDKAGIVTSISGNVFTVANTTTEVNLDDLVAVLKVKDQYGVELPADAAKLTTSVTNKSTGVTVTNKVVSGLESGKEFTVKYYAANGTSVQVRVVVE